MSDGRDFAGRWRAVAAAGLATLCCGAAPGCAACALEAVAVLPLTSVGGFLAFPADIGGKEADLILDTGASTTSLRLATASRFGISLYPLEREYFGIGGWARAYRGMAWRLRVGSIDLDGHFVGGTSVALPQGLDGFLGMDVLATYDLDLDLAGRHAVVYEANGGCGTPTVALAPPLFAVPLAYSRDDLQTEVDVSIGGKRFRALIDSGAPVSAMFRRAASRLRLDMSALTTPQAQSSRGVGGFAVRSFPHVFDSISIGTLVLHGFTVDVIDQADFGVRQVRTGSLLADSSRGEAGGEDMLLGVDFLRAVHVWISHSSQRLIMQYPPAASVLPR